MRMRRPLLMPLLMLLLLASPLALARAAERSVPATEPAAGAPDRIELWPQGQVPGETGPASVPNVIERSTDPALPDRYIDNLSAPYLVVYRPPGGAGRRLPAHRAGQGGHRPGAGVCR
jgi:hypothetical protein